MTIQEAIKTGKPFRRTGNEYWHHSAPLASFVEVDIIAEDWEVKREPREFTVYKQGDNWMVTDMVGAIEYRGERPTNFIRVREVLDEG